MLYEEIFPNKSYYSTRYQHNERKQLGREREKQVIKYFVIRKDDKRKRVEVTVQGAPARWVTQNNFRYWQINNPDEEKGSKEKAKANY